MDALKFKAAYSVGIDGKRHENADVRATPVGEGECRGYGYYISAVSETGVSDFDGVILLPDEPDTDKYVAIENHSPFWCRPFWGSGFKCLPQKTQELLIFTGDVWRCYLPVCGDVFKTVLRGSPDGLEIYMSSGVNNADECRGCLAFICMEGKDPIVLLRSIASHAAELLGNGLKMRGERKYPDMLEYLGWCSWDAFQIRVNHDGLMKKAAEFADKNVPVGYGIIDDMWADVPDLNDIPTDASFGDMVSVMHKSKLRSFEGDPVRFPEGMKKTVGDLNDAGIPHIGIWFPATGYWSGLEPDSEAANDLRHTTVKTEGGKIIAAPDKEKADEYFGYFCSKVSDFGADFVKIDNQGYLREYLGMIPSGRCAGIIQSSIGAAVEKYFGGAIINCMGMSSDCMFHRTDTAVCRCSDDFIPESREWFSKNILQCSFNGLLQGMYQVNDWDMWWTDDGQAVKNSICRAISGGPIYVSDKLGRTNPEILKPLCLSDGRILRCDESAAPTGDCLIENPAASRRIFKVKNRIGKNGIIAVFNLNADGKSVAGTVSPTDAELEAGEYAWYEYFTKACGILGSGDRLDVALDCTEDYRLYTFAPLEDDAAVIGRTDLYIGIKAVHREGREISFCGGGEIGIVSREPVRATCGGLDIHMTRRGMLTTLIPPANAEKFNIE